MDKFDRYPGETDAELRKRIIDTPIAKRARASIWRVFGMKNKDEPLPVVYLNGVEIAYVADVTYTIDRYFEETGPTEITLLDRLEVQDIVVAGKKK